MSEEEELESLELPKEEIERKGIRSITIHIPDKKYMDLLIKIRNENIGWKRFFTLCMDGFIEDDPGIMKYIDASMSLVRSKRRTKILDKERKLVEETIKTFGLEEDEINDIYDILEESVDPWYTKNRNEKRSKSLN